MNSNLAWHNLELEYEKAKELSFEANQDIYAMLDQLQKHLNMKDDNDDASDKSKLKPAPKTLKKLHHFFFFFTFFDRKFSLKKIVFCEWFEYIYLFMDLFFQVNQINRRKEKKIRVL